MEDVKSWQKELEAIHNRPGMYLGNTDKPFTTLLGFMTGYQCGYAAGKNGFMAPEHLVPDGFGKFVTEHFGHAFPSGKGWSMFISENSASEQEAFDSFFRLRAEYEKQTPSTLA